MRETLWTSGTHRCLRSRGENRRPFTTLLAARVKEREAIMKRVDADMEALILRHKLVDDWPVGTIASQLGIHHDVVRRVIAQHNVPASVKVRRTRMEDPYVDFIKETLSKYPKLHASRLYQMAKERGFPGSESHFRKVVAGYRPKKTPEPFLRLTKIVADEAQVDWGHFGSVQIGNTVRKLYAFVMTLSWSRMIWLQFFHDMQMANFLRGHVDALSFFGGTPRKLLYDNLKSAVVERHGNAIRFNEDLLQLATHYGFEPRAAAPRRGNEKGCVERSIRYVRASFFAAREFHSITRLNEEAVVWSREISANRCWPQDDQRLVLDVFVEERAKLRTLPSDPFPAYERKTVSVGRTPWIRFDKNDYSVPAKYVRQTVDVLADHQRIRVVADGDIVCDHCRSFERRASIEDPAHMKAVRQYKRKARLASAGDRLRISAPSSESFLHRAAERGSNLGGMVSTLLTLLDTYGGPALEVAISAINDKELASANAVRQLLEQQARAANRNPPSPVRLPRPELENLIVREPKLSIYDQNEESDSND